jgi:hypothetical protein
MGGGAPAQQSRDIRVCRDRSMAKTTRFFLTICRPPKSANQNRCDCMTKTARTILSPSQCTLSLHFHPAKRPAPLRAEGRKGVKGTIDTRCCGPEGWVPAWPDLSVRSPCDDPDWSMNQMGLGGMFMERKQLMQTIGKQDVF